MFKKKNQKQSWNHNISIQVRIFKVLWVSNEELKFEML